MAARYFALLIGIAFVLAGIGGFIPAVTQLPVSPAPDVVMPESYGYLLGLFPINALHNLVHLGFGLWGLASYRHYAAARQYARGLAIILGILTIMGLIPGLNTAFGLLPLFSHDIWLHAAEAVIAFYLGFLAPEQNSARAQIQT